MAQPMPIIVRKYPNNSLKPIFVALNTINGKPGFEWIPDGYLQYEDNKKWFSVKKPIYESDFTSAALGNARRDGSQAN